MDRNAQKPMNRARLGTTGLLAAAVLALVILANDRSAEARFLSSISNLDASIADSDLDWESDLTVESRVPGTYYYLRIRNRGWWTRWVRFATSKMESEWNPRYYRTYVIPFLKLVILLPMREGDVILVPPLWSRYVLVRVTEPNAPAGHLLPDFTFYWTGVLFWRPWAKFDEVEANVLVPGNLMYTKGKADLLSVWTDEDKIAKTTDINEIMTGASYNHELDAKAVTFTLRTLNADNGTSDFLFREVNNAFQGTARYYDGGNEITDQVTHAGYAIPDLEPGESFDIRMVVVPVGKSDDYQKITLMAAITDTTEPVAYHGPYERFDALNIAFKTTTGRKLDTTGWREIHGD